MANNKTLLLIEDDPLLAKLTASRFEEEGYTVIHAPDGESAIEWIGINPLPSLIILDVILPKISGFEVLTELKARDITSKVPIIVTSNLAQDSDVKKAQDLGAAAYLKKASISVEDIVKVAYTLGKGEVSEPSLPPVAS